jgi:hypothetical protein
VDVSRAEDQYGTRQVNTAVDLTCWRAVNYVPRSAKGSPREAVGLGCFQSPKGQSHLPFHLALVDEQESLEQWNAFRHYQNGRQLQYDNQTTLCTNHTVLHNTGESAPFAPVPVRGAGVVRVRFMSKFHMTRLLYLPQYPSDKALEMGWTYCNA